MGSWSWPHETPGGRRPAPSRTHQKVSLVLSDFWFGVITVLWPGFFLLEGFDFGVGLLLPVLAPGEGDRVRAIRTIGPTWDGNEVWLIVAGGATFAAFPAWYAEMFSGLYLPLAGVLAHPGGGGAAPRHRGGEGGDHDGPGPGGAVAGAGARSGGTVPARPGCDRCGGPRGRGRGALPGAQRSRGHRSRPGDPGRRPDRAGRDQRVRQDHAAGGAAGSGAPVVRLCHGRRRPAPPPGRGLLGGERGVAAAASPAHLRRCGRRGAARGSGARREGTGPTAPALLRPAGAYRPGRGRPGGVGRPETAGHWCSSTSPPRTSTRSPP